MNKKFSMGDMSVKSKITFFSAIMLILMFLIEAAGLWSTTMTNNDRKAIYDDYGESKLLLSNANSDFCQVKTHLRNAVYIYSEDSDADKRKSEIETTKKYMQECRSYLDAYAAKLDKFDDNIDQKYKVFENDIQAYKAVVEEAISYVENGDLDGAKTMIKNGGLGTADDAETSLDALIADMDSATKAHDSEINYEINVLRYIMIAIFVVSLIITILYSASLVRAITIPVASLSEAAKKLAKGDVDIKCIKLHNDDLGELMDNFEIMADGIKEQVKVTDNIAKGDLTVDVIPRSERDILGKGLKKLVYDNNVTLGNIKESSAQITVGSEQVANASHALAQGSTEQASALEQVTASMDEVTQRTKVNATEASTANNLVINVKDMAATGNNKMKSMIEAMNDINESSSTISKIIKTIDDIAFQTNILALNAAVEAARAGVHGKGFAVVAEEVRNLAAKSASAASETADMIQDSINKVNNGTKLVEDTAKALDEIVKSIDEIVTLIGHITSSSNEQATSISQIDQAISQVASVVQTNAATSEQCAAASEELSNQAVTLRRLVANYKLASGIGGGMSMFANNDAGDYVSSDDVEAAISFGSADDKY